MTVHRQLIISSRRAFKLSREVSRELRYIKKCQAILQSEGTRLLSHPGTGFNHCWWVLLSPRSKMPEWSFTHVCLTSNMNISAYHFQTQGRSWPLHYLLIAVTFVKRGGLGYWGGNRLFGGRRITLLVDRKHHFPKNSLAQPHGWSMDTSAAHHECYLNRSILMGKHSLE